MFLFVLLSIILFRVNIIKYECCGTYVTQNKSHDAVIFHYTSKFD